MQSPDPQIRALKLQHLQLLDMLEGMSAEQLNYRYVPDKWSIREHLAHLGRYQEIFQERISRMLNEASPSFGRYVAEQDPGFEAWQQQDLLDILRQVEVERKKLMERWQNLSVEDRARSGSHPKLGKMLLEDWMRFFLLHESHHHYAIFWLKHRGASSLK